MRRTLATLILAVLSIAAAAQNLTITPTTTYAAETGNNTSTANTFTGWNDGNIGATNISKVDTHTLLYPGFNGKIYAHVEPWWGSSSHPSIGYNSGDPAQVQKQIDDILSRGMNGEVVDWYGPGSYEDGTDKTLFSVAQSNPNFSIIVEIDVGAMNWHSCYPTCSATTAAINLFTTMGNQFFSSPNYAKLNGRPMALEFGFETLSLPSGYATGWNVVDWNAVQSQVPGNVAFYHRNLGGFSKAQSAGAFGWMEPKTTSTEPVNYDGTDELTWFYGQSYTTNAAKTVGAAWKGFNDILASWAPTGGRHIEQNCGQTWLNTFNEINTYYSATNQLEAFQLVTWNDYEEGTEIETGIDNCVTVNASVTGSTLQWTITGSANTIDHYTVFISTDGQNLMPLSDFAVGTTSVDLATFSPAAGTYTLYVKAIGKPSLTNKMSNAATLTIAATSTSTLSVTPTTGNAPLAVSANVTSTATGTVSGASTLNSTATTINWGDGTSSTGTTGSHTYSTPGTYTVSATNSGTTTTVTAKALAPTAALSLSATSASTGTAITASTSASTDPNQGGSISGSTIDFGDGTITAGPSASHSYATAGTYNVTATVTDNYGVSSTKSQSLSITSVPTAVTIASPVTGSTVTGPSVQFSATASSPNGVGSMILYVDYNQVGPVYSSSTLNTTVSLAPGTHPIAVNAWDKTGALIQSTKGSVTVVAIAPTTSLSLSATSATAPATITATSNSTDTNVGSTVTTTINWGDGTTSSGASASHTYSTAGTYTVTATATDNYGKSSSASQTLTVAAAVAVAPTASMTVSMNGTTATVTSTSKANSGSITSTVINWGDGTSTSAASASHNYSQGGYYTITLTVTNSYSKSASTSQQVTATAIVIWLPAPGANKASPVHIAATAYDTKAIASMAVYVDGNQVYLGYVSDLDIWTSLKAGTHSLVVKAWESGTGVVYKASETFSSY